MAWLVSEIEYHIPWNPDLNLYNCSGRLYEEWVARGSPQLLKGLMTLVSGIVVMVVYIVTIIAMTSNEFLRHSCYQLMYFASLNDIVNVFVANVAAGYFTIVGGTFCTHPISNYLIGCVATGFWCGSCISIAVLALSRLAEITGYLKWLFTGFLVYFWVFFSFTYSFWIMFFTKPSIFNSAKGILLVAPLIDDDLEREQQVFKNTILPITSVISATVVVLAYSFIFIYLRKSQTDSGNNGFTGFQKKVLVQCTIICLLFAVSSYMYTYLSLFPVPMWFMMICMMFYEMNECAPLFCYLVLNTTIRKRVKKIIRLQRFDNIVGTSYTPSGKPNPVSNGET